MKVVFKILVASLLCVMGASRSPCTLECHNGGFCVKVDEGGQEVDDDLKPMTCFCPPPWSGPHCDIQDDENLLRDASSVACDLECLNGGSCVVDGDDFFSLPSTTGMHCLCSASWGGSNCQDPSVVTEFPTMAPTEFPTMAPTEFPTMAPTEFPTMTPVTDDLANFPFPTMSPDTDDLANFPTMAPDNDDIANFPTMAPDNDDAISFPPTMAPDGDDGDDNNMEEDDEVVVVDDDDDDGDDNGDDSVDRDEDRDEDNDDEEEEEEDDDDDNADDLPPKQDDDQNAEDDDDGASFGDENIGDDPVGRTDDARGDVDDDGNDDAMDDRPMGMPNRDDDGFGGDGPMGPFPNRPNRPNQNGMGPFPTDDQFLIDDKFMPLDDDGLEDAVGGPVGPRPPFPNQDGDNVDDAVGGPVGTSNDDFMLNTDDVAAAPAYHCPSGWTGPSCEISFVVSNRRAGFCPLSRGRCTAVYRPVQCGVTKCEYSNQCVATGAGFSTRDCKPKKVLRRRLLELLQGAYSKPMSSSIKNDQGDEGNASLRLREGAMEGLDKTHAAGNNMDKKIQRGVRYFFVEEDNDGDMLSTPDVADDDDSTQIDDSDDHKTTPPEHEADDDDLVQPGHTSTGAPGSDDDDSFQPEQGTSTGLDDDDNDIPVQPDHRTTTGDDDDTPVQPDHDTNSADDDDATSPPDHGKSVGEDDDDAHFHPDHGTSHGNDDDDHATFKPDNGTVPDYSSGSGGMSAFVTIALVIVAMSGLLVAWRKLMLWRLQRSRPPADMPIWVRDTELETYNDHPDDKYSDHRGGGSNENHLLTFASEESTRPASKLDRLPNFVRPSSNGDNDIC